MTEERLITKLYSAVRELVRALGADKVRRMYFGPPAGPRRVRAS